MRQWIETALLYAAVLLPATLGTRACCRGGLLRLALAGVFAVGGIAGRAAAELGAAGPLYIVCAAAAAGMLYALAVGELTSCARADRTVGQPLLGLLFAVPAVLRTGGAGDLLAVRPQFLLRLGETDISLWIPLGILLLALAAFLLYGTRWGLHQRAWGENPQALEEAGVGVAFHRCTGLLMAGCLGGIGGLAAGMLGDSEALGLSAGGAALLVLATVRFGGSRTWKTLLAVGALAMLRAAADCAGVLPTLSQWALPPEAWQALPYAAALILAAGSGAGQPEMEDGT